MDRSLSQVLEFQGSCPLDKPISKHDDSYSSRQSALLWTHLVVVRKLLQEFILVGESWLFYRGKAIALSPRAFCGFISSPSRFCRRAT